MKFGDEAELFNNVKEWVNITVDSRTYRVPKGVTIMRALQFLRFSMDYSRICWNGECLDCVCSFSNSADTQQSKALACMTLVEEGMSLKTFPSAVSSTAVEE